MVFKVIDEAVAGAGQPFDAFTLLGIAQNLDAAYMQRPRRASRTFLPDNAPVFFGVGQIMVWAPTLWPLSPGCTEVKVRLLFVCQDAPVKLYPVIAQGPAVDVQMDGMVEVVQTDTVITLTFDTSAFDGLVVLGIGVESVVVDTPDDKVTLSPAAHHEVLLNDYTISFGAGANLVLDPDHRYAVRAINAADEDYDPRLLPEVAVLGWDTVAAAVDVLNVWPPIRPDDEESFFGSTIDLSIHLAGSLTVSSMCVEETDFVDLAPLRPALSGGQAPIARAVRQLYQRAHDQHLRTSIKTIGGQPDPTHIDRMARAVTTTGTIVPLEQLYVIDIPVYDAATTYKVTVQGVDYTAVGAGSAATTLLSLHSSIRLSAGNVAVDARILGAYLVLRPRSAYVISPTVNATGGTGTITNTATRRRTLGGVLITGYSDDAGVVDGDDSSASYRTKMEVAMLMAVCGPGGPADEVVEVFPVARLGSFNAGGWDGLEEYTSLGGVQLQCVKADEGLSRAWRVLHYLNSNINYAGEIPRQTARWHTLRGAIPLFAMRLDPPSGGVPFYTIVRGTVQDDEPEETHRLLRLYVDGVPWNVNESTNGATEYLPRLLYCPAITVWGTEEVRP